MNAFFQNFNVAACPAMPRTNTKSSRCRRAGWLLIAALGSAQLLGAWTTHAAAVSAMDSWPQWRGPLNTGVAPAANPPVTWSETNNVKWKVTIPGEGSATPIIWGNQIFIQTAIPTGKKVENPAPKPEAPPAATNAPSVATNTPTTNSPPRVGGRGTMGLTSGQPDEYYQFVLLCLDRQTGKVRWQQIARVEVPHEGHHPTDSNFAGPSPVTDGQHVFAYFGSRGLYCYDLNGQLQWSRDFGKMRIAMGFGEGSSPALYQDTLVINWDNEGGSFIIALDKKTGQTLWKQPREEKTSWATPLIVEHNGISQVITAATGKIRSYDLVTGKLIWECAGLTRNVIPSPVADHGLVYCMSGYSGNALLAIRLGRAGDLTGTDAIAWSCKKSTPYVPSPLLAGGKLYFLSNNKGSLSCFNAADGKPFYTDELLPEIPDVFASPVGAAGRIYLPGRNGVTVVLKQSEKPEKLAVNRLDDKFDASPAAVGGELFLRGKSHLYCLAEK